MSEQTRKGQLFTADLLMAIVVMTAALFAFTYYTSGKPAPQREDVEAISTLLTEGVPQTWDETNVIVVGFTTDNRLNRTKIATFESLPYSEQKKLLGIASDFTIRFVMNGTEIALCSTCGAPLLSYDELLPVTRWSILDGNVTAMHVRLYR